MKRWIWGMAASILFTALLSCNDKNKSSAEDEQKLALVQSLQQQVKQSPDSASIRMKLVNALDSLGMHKEAIAQTDSLIKRDSANNGLWFARGQLQESLPDTAAAIESYKRAIAIYPSVDAQLSLANLYAEKKDLQSLVICQNVAKLGLDRETEANCDFIAGVYHSRVGHYDLALQMFDRSIQNNYTLMEAYMEKGFIYYEQKKYNDALKVFQTAITVNNLYADAYYWQAKCYEAMGNKQEAITNYQRALGLDREMKEAKAALKRLE